MMNTKVTIAGVDFKNPVMTASLYLDWILSCIFCCKLVAVDEVVEDKLLVFGLLLIKGVF